MKKLFALLISLAFSFMLLAGCMERPDDIRVYMPDGAPALALARMVAMAEPGEDGMTDRRTFGRYDRGVTYSLVAESALAATVAKGDADIAIMPTNAAASVFNKGAKIKIVSINVHGLVYMVGKAEITDLNQLKGKVVYSIGQTGTPGFMFQYILTQAGIEFETGTEPIEGKVVINYVVEGPAVIAALKGGLTEYGILGEPAATKAISATESVLALDLQEEWSKATDGMELPQACMVIKESLIESDLEFVNAFLQEVSDSDAWLKSHPEEATQALIDLGSTTAQGTTFTADIISRCNIKTVPIKETLTSVKQYLNELYSFNASAVGGQLPSDDLYYQGA